jgi:hypothetical protein
MRTFLELSPFNFLIIICLVLAHYSPASAGDEMRVGQWDVFEQTFQHDRQYDDPFGAITLDVTYTRPNGTQVQFYGFYKGGSEWAIRFMPDTVGHWQYSARFSDGSNSFQGRFRCVPSDIPGLISQHASNPIWFGYRGGAFELVRSFHVGDRFFANTPNAHTGESWGPDERNGFLDWAKAQGYNMLSIASHYLNRNVETRGKGWQTPDLWDSLQQRPDPVAFDDMEAVLNDLKERKLLVYPFAGFFGKEADFPREQKAQETYLRYCLARLAPYWNVLFLVGGPEPLYKKNPHLTFEEINWLGALIDSLDVFDHLLSVHNPTGDDPFIYKDWLSYGVLQGPKTTDRRELYEGLLKNHHPQKPLYAQETLWPGNMYGHPDYTVDDIRKNTYVATMAAAAINFADMDGNSSSGFSGTIDMDQRHQVWHDEIKSVWDFLETTAIHTMVPAPNLVNTGYCLADVGRQYIVYLEKTEAVDVALENGPYQVTWINAGDTGKRVELPPTKTGKDLAPPAGGDDWILILTKE